MAERRVFDFPGLVAAWNACRDGPLSSGLLEELDRACEATDRALESDEAVRDDASEGGARLRLDYHWAPDVLDALAGVMRRGDELDDARAERLTNLATDVVRTAPQPITLQRVRDMGFLRPALVLSKRRSLGQFIAAAHLLLASIRGHHEGPALVQESRDAGVDLVGLIGECLSTRCSWSEASHVCELMEELVCGRPMPPLDVVREVLNILKTERVMDDALSMGHEYIIVKLCGTMETTTPGLEQVLLEAHVFQGSWPCLEQGFASYKPDICSMIRRISQMSPSFQQTFLQSNFVDMVVMMTLKDSVNAIAGYDVLKTMVECFDDASIGAFVSNTPRLWSLVSSYDSGSHEYACNFMRCLISRYNERIQSREKWPILQLHLIQYIFLDCLHPDVAGQIRQFMRSTPMSLCIRELKELAIPGITNILLHPSSTLLRHFLHEKLLHEEGLELVWLAFAIGFQLPRDELGKSNYNLLLVEGRFTDERSRRRIQGMYTIIWAVGIGSIPRFQSLETAKSWLPRELWRLVWEKLYQ